MSAGQTRAYGRFLLAQGPALYKYVRIFANIDILTNTCHNISEPLKARMRRRWCFILEISQNHIFLSLLLSLISRFLLTLP